MKEIDKIVKDVKIKLMNTKMSWADIELAIRESAIEGHNMACRNMYHEQILKESNV